MKNQSQIRKKPLTKGQNAQRKSGRRRSKRITPSPQARLLGDAIEEERKGRICELIAWIEENGTSLQRITVSNFIQTMVTLIQKQQKRVRRQLAG